MSFMNGAFSGLKFASLALCTVFLVSCDIAPSEPVLEGKWSPKQTSETATKKERQSARPDHSDASAAQKKPNILLILADDLGYFDIGAYGGEIDTPNIDALAQKGVRFRQLRAAPICAPSRAMLMTGLDNHLVGIGAQFPKGAQIGAPGYEGFLAPQTPTIAETLRGAGYDTFMAGKWHLGKTEEQSPAARGFDSSFALLTGAASHLDMRGPSPSEGVTASYRENGKMVEELPDGFYSSDFYTDRIISDIDHSLSNDKPFFAYLAYTSPHWPLQAPDEYLDKYQGAYDEGYDAICQSRFDKAKSLNVIPADTKFSGCRSLSAPWANLSDDEKRREARLMELYAAMIDNLDDNIGRLVAHLESIEELDNTFIFFLSDNGADGRRREKMPDIVEWIATDFDNSFDNMGRAGSFVSTGQNWASVSMSPIKDFKGTVSDGGIRVPAIAVYPEIGRGGEWFDGPVTIRDIAPTFYALAGAEPKLDSKIPMQGTSFLGELRDPSAPTHTEGEIFVWENDGSKAVLQGDYKLTRNARRVFDTDWVLFNLKDDPFETTDISDKLPNKTAEMIAHFEKYENDVGIVYANNPGAPSGK